MKINSKSVSIKMLAVCSALSYMQSLHTFFSDHFEQSFMQRMHKIQKEMQDICHDFSHAAFKNMTIPSRTLIITNNPSNKSSLQQDAVQESSQSLSFTNQEKSITLTSLKNSMTKNYTISMTDKHNEIENDQEPVIVLRDLQDYIQTKFKSASANVMLQECIDALEQEQDNNFISVQSSCSKNRLTYTIDIESKKTDKEEDNQNSNLEDLQTEHPKSYNDRKKKKNHRQSSHKKDSSDF